MSERIHISHCISDQFIAGPIELLQINPSDPDDLEVHGPEADERIVSGAAIDARAAQAEMAELGAEARSDLLFRIASEIEQRGEALARLMARETGKTIRDSRNEVTRSVRIFRFFAAEALRNVGEQFESTRRGVQVRVTYEPVGVIGVITPWNFPLAIPAWKIAPALCFGNSVVWKPSELASATAASLMDAIKAASPPKGAVNLIVGRGKAGALVCENPAIDAVTFTGSEQAGARVRATCALRGAAVQLEMGGVNGLIIADDADLELAVSVAVDGAYFNAGQRCTATSRLIVMKSVADSFITRFARRTATLAIGKATDERTDIGPLVSAAHKRVVLERLEKTKGRLIVGKKASDDQDATLQPMLFDNVAADDILATEEVFAPVACLLVAESFEAALNILNSTRFGLSAGLCTQSLSRSEAFLSRARAGMTMINLPTAGVDYHAPFGGAGSSSYGLREQGRAARQFFTKSKTAYVRT